MKKITAKLLAVLCVTCLIAGMCLLPSAAAETEKNVVFSEDFSADAGVFGDNVSVANGEATITTENQMFTLEMPEGTRLESNNYVVSFDMKYTSATQLFLHFVGLNGNDNSNIYMAAEENGTYWSIRDFYGHNCYNNSGNQHGGLDYNAAPLGDFVHVELVHYNGYVELWLNGTRRIVSHLSNFGNNQYDTRDAIAEGVITGIGLHAVNGGAVVIDNFSVTEAVAQEAYGTFVSQETNPGAELYLPLSARNLDHENFRVTGTFVIADEKAADYYPSINLYGLNASLLSKNNRSYGVNFQSYVNGMTVLPQIFAQTEETEWVSGGDATETKLASGQELQYRIDVYGDHIQFYVNEELKLDTSFTALGIAKGHLQYIRICGGAGAYWKNVQYAGLDAESGAVITSDAEAVVLTQDTITLNAAPFGAATDESFAWYVNGEKQAETASKLVLSKPEAGKYEIVYKSQSFASNVISFEVVRKHLTVSADALEMYPDGAVTLTAAIRGDVTGDALAWYVNGEKKADGAEPLTLTGLEPGNYVVTLRAGDTVSNGVSVTVLPEYLQIASSRQVYKTNETAALTATVVGASTDEITWYINGAEVEGNHTTELSVAVGDYADAEKIMVTAAVGDLKSEEFVLFVSTDILNEIISSENYESISAMDVTADGSYGTYKVGTDDGNYLYMTDLGGSWCDYTGAMPFETGFIWEYKLYIPADLAGKYYVYPCLTALDSNYSSAMMETAVEISPEGIRPYFKNQGSGTLYEHGIYGLGVDTSYEGVAKLGDWNTISLAVQGTHAAMYLNGEQILFVSIQTMGVPTGISLNMWPDDGGLIPLKLKDFTVTGKVSPAPDLQSVTVSVSKLEAQVGDEVKVTASLNPFNAEAKEIQWFVNDAPVDGDGLSYTFVAKENGSYKIHCVIDGITSSAKTVTVAEPVADDAPESGNTVVIVVIAVVAVIAAAVVGVVIYKKKNNLYIQGEAQ